MKQKDVIIGNEYNIQMEGKPVRVKVIGDRGYENGVSRKYRVRRVDNGNVLPKYRTCGALYQLQQSETNQADIEGIKKRIVCVAKVEVKAEDVTIASLEHFASTTAIDVTADIAARAVAWANHRSGHQSSTDDIITATRVIHDKTVTTEWCLALREFVKLWRDGQAPDRPLPVFGQS